MKALNLTALALGGALVIVMGISMLADAFLDKSTAMLVVMPIGLLVGLSARRVTEKFLGYTLLEALKADQNDADGN